MILWIAVAVQMIAFAWYSMRGGILSDRSYLVFTFAMMAGQIATGIDAYCSGAAWKALSVSAYFFSFEVVGLAQRIRKILRDKKDSFRG